MAKIVKAAMALIDLLDGTTVSVVRGGAVPDNVKPEHLEHLEAFDLVEDGDALAGLEPSRAGDGSELKPAEPASPVKTDGAPAKNAKLEDWQAYATSKGATDADLEGKSRDDLVAAYGG